MKKGTLIIAICFVSTFLTRAQQANLQLFYSINQIESTQNFQRVDSFLAGLKVKSINIRLIGYADFLSDANYNQTLSLKRAQAIKNHLSNRTKLPHVNVLSCIAKGESLSKDNQDTNGEPMQRRVDLIIEASSTNSNVNTQPIKIEEPIKESIKPELISGKKLQEIEVGQSIELTGVSFVPGRHIVLESSVPILYELLEIMKAHPNLKIEIQGHVCCVEDFKPDALDYGTGERKLSVNRAKAVFDFLRRNGIDKSRLTYKGFGHKHPKVEPENTPEDEQMNRRVEVMLLEK